MSKFKIIFIHGYTASSKADWYPNISKMLIKAKVDFVIPDLPGGEYPHASEWLTKIHEIVSKTTKPLIFVGHSLGTRSVLLYLEKYKLKVEKVFLIAAFANRVENAKRNEGKAYPDFFTHRVDLSKIKPLVGKFIVIHSKDDTSIPYEQAVEIAEELDAKLVTFQGRGHLYAPENAPAIFNELKKELNLYFRK